MPYNSPMPEREPRKKVPGAMQNLVQAEKLLQVAFVLPSATVVGWLAGAWADQSLAPVLDCNCRNHLWQYFRARLRDPHGDGRGEECRIRRQKGKE